MSIPGPGLLSSLRTIPRLQKNIIPPMVELFSKYGDYAKLKLLGREIVFVFHPDSVAHVLKKRYKNYIKGLDNEAFHQVLGEGLLTSSGDTWLKGRRILGPEFQAKKMGHYHATFCKHLRTLVKKWENDQRVVDIGKEMAKLAFSIGSESFFGAELDQKFETVARAVEIGNKVINARMTSLVPFPLWLPVPSHVQLRKSIDEIDAIIYSIIKRENSAPGSTGGSLLARLTQLKDEDNRPYFTDRELRDHICTFLFAGFDTTSVTMCWALYLLSRNTGVQNNMRDELNKKVSSDLPTFEELQTLDYSRMTLQEAMRLFPASPAIAREAVEADSIGPHAITAGTEVNLSPWVTHRHPEFWSRPEDFDPLRFQEPSIKSRHPFAYFPFGGGPRECIGANFGQIEALIVLASLIKNFRFAPVNEASITPFGLITVHPEQNIMLKVEPV